jgi:RimJ/RimL family protein N-acetyltransferase
VNAPDPPLADEVVLLRPWTQGDVGDIVRCCNDPLIPRFIPVIPIPYTEEDARGFVERTVIDTELNLAITGRASGVVLGAVGVGFRTADEGAAEIGYWLAPEARGHGHATRALRLLSGWSLRQLGIARLELRTDVDNAASQRVAGRAGFTREAVMRSATATSEGPRDTVVFSLLPGEA